ncbi:MAG: GH92 family glycosyl hydrolase [Saprospiraceae bacterium]
MPYLWGEPSKATMFQIRFQSRSFLFILPFFLGTALWQSPPPSGKAVNPLAYVDPFIGTGGHGHTFPGATTPFGMVQLSPDTRPDPSEWDGCSGYHYSDEQIYGFSHTHLSGTGVPDYCDILVMPYTGKGWLNPEDYASSFDKKNEHAEAGYYSVLLDRNNIQAELTATERVGVHRYTFPDATEIGHIMFDLRHRDLVQESSMTATSDREVVGYRLSTSWAENQYVYFVAHFSKPFFSSKILDMTMDPHISQRAVSSKAVVGLLDFYTEGEPLVVTVGISAVSIDAARNNLRAECPDYDFDRVKNETQAKWLEKLSKVNVEAGTEKQLKAFYTALYHTMIAPNTFSDSEGYYRGRDLKIHHSRSTVYTVFSLWDTYRACHPLYTLLEPERANDFIQTFLLQYKQGGRLPIWELAANETDCMIGNHAIPVIADAYLKGIRDFDADLALEAMIHSAMQDRLGLEYYRELGYIPSDMESESVSKTLEYAFDDWSIARMAEAMGKDSIRAYFDQRSLQYRNLFNPETQFFQAKTNASWQANFDPFEVNFNFTEANAWQYRFAAPQDVSGMMQLHGGPEAFTQTLNELFEVDSKINGRQQADITGLIGQYVHGNEPSHHMAYLYNFTGATSQTQKRVRQIMDSMYSDQPDGLSGNEDCGQMSAWLVYSALGFYPAVPVGGVYTIGTPWFEETTLQLPNGKELLIKAPGCSANKPYIKSLQFNGKPWTQNWISHADLMEGGTLVFEMSAKPQTWGSEETARPVTRIEDAQFVPEPYVTQGKRVFETSQEIQLGCLDGSAKIMYALVPLDSSEELKWKRYRRPIVLEQTSTIRFKAVREKTESRVAEAIFSQLQPNLKVVRYNTQYDNQYTGRGENGIIDLLYGGADFRSGGWQGYQGVNVDVILDQGSSKPIHLLAANFFQDENSWIFFPKRVIYEVSEDGENFTQAGVVENTVSPREKGMLHQAFEFRPESELTARYIRVVGESLQKCPEWHKGAGLPCWLFIDEVAVQ